MTDLIELNRLETMFGVMVDASAGDWCDGNLPTAGHRYGIGIRSAGGLLEPIAERHPIPCFGGPVCRGGL